MGVCRPLYLTAIISLSIYGGLPLPLGHGSRYARMLAAQRPEVGQMDGDWEETLVNRAGPLYPNQQHAPLPLSLWRALCEGLSDDFCQSLAPSVTLLRDLQRIGVVMPSNHLGTSLNKLSMLHDSGALPRSLSGPTVKRGRPLSVDAPMRSVSEKIRREQVKQTLELLRNLGRK